MKQCFHRVFAGLFWYLSKIFTYSFYALALVIGLSEIPVSAAQAVAVTNATTARDAQVVLIAYAGTLSGAAAGVGKSQVSAAQLAVDEANQRGLTIQGKPVLLQLLVQNDRADPRTAEFIARYLVSSHVVGVIGHWSSAASVAAAPIYRAAGIIQLLPAVMSTVDSRSDSRSAFRTIGNYDSAARYTADYAVKTLGSKRFMLVSDGSPFGNSFTAQFGRTAKESGGQILSSHSISDKTSDFNSILADIARSQPDAVLFGGQASQAAELVRTMRRHKLAPRFIGAAGSAGLAFLKEAGTDGNGSVVLEAGLPPEKMPGWKAFEKRYMDKFDTNIDLSAAAVYDATQVLIAAIRRANSVLPEEVAQAMRGLRFNGLSGAISFNQHGDLQQPVFTVYEVQEQRWVVRKIINAASVN